MKKTSTEIIKEFVDSGFKTVIVCVNDRYLDKSFAGRVIDKAFLNDLPDNVDPCGENGEYHSIVINSPDFQRKLMLKSSRVTSGEFVYLKIDEVSF